MSYDELKRQHEEHMARVAAKLSAATGDMHTIKLTPDINDLAEVDPRYLRLYSINGPHSLYMEGWADGLKMTLHLGNSFAGMIINREQAEVLHRWLGERLAVQR